MAKARARAASKKDEIESPVVKVKRSKSNQGKIMPKFAINQKFQVRINFILQLTCKFLLSPNNVLEIYWFVDRMMSVS